jgi:hypothetical protein
MQKIITFLCCLFIYSSFLESMDITTGAKVALTGAKSKTILCLGVTGVVIGGVYFGYKWWNSSPSHESKPEKPPIPQALPENLIAQPQEGQIVSITLDPEDKPAPTSTIVSDPEADIVYYSGGSSNSDSDDSDTELMAERSRGQKLSKLLDKIWEQQNRNDPETEYEIRKSMRHPRYQTDTRNQVEIFLQWFSTTKLNQERIGDLVAHSHFSVREQQNINAQNTLDYGWADGALEGAYSYCLNTSFKKLKTFAIRDEQS